MPTTLVRIPSFPPDDESSSASRFAEPVDEGPDLATVVRRIRGAKRIVVVCGAGVSTAARIPDFRSAHGLFAGSKGHSVKDLFHVKSLSSPALLPDHHALLSNLSRLCGEAEPTDFHTLLRTLDTEGRLLRCYTQNIDGLEERAGLSTGIPPPRPVRKGKRTNGEGTPTAEQLHPPSAQPSQGASPSQPPSQGSPFESGVSSPAATDDEGYKPAPRCIPLHGLLSTLHCTLCTTRVPISKHLPLPGAPIACPQCDLASELRSALSERQRKVGTLRASVVLYGEEHPEGEQIGSVMERDLRGTGRRGEREGRADLLLVAGTSLSIPGVKRIVKEMAKSLATRSGASVRDGREPPLRAVYVNSEPPAKPAEWDGVFDVWAQGDVQALAVMVADESFAPPLPKTPRRTPKKKSEVGELPTPNSGTPTKRKRKVLDDTPTKKRGSALPLTPAYTPPRGKTSSDLPSPSPAPRYGSSPLSSPPSRMEELYSPPPRVELYPPSPPPANKKSMNKAKSKSRPTKAKDTGEARYLPSSLTKGVRKVKVKVEDEDEDEDEGDAAGMYPTPSKSASSSVCPSGVSRFSPPPPLDELYTFGGGGGGGGGGSGSGSGSGIGGEGGIGGLFGRRDGCGSSSSRG